MLLVVMMLHIHNIFLFEIIMKMNILKWIPLKIFHSNWWPWFCARYYWRVCLFWCLQLYQWWCCNPVNRCWGIDLHYFRRRLGEIIFPSWTVNYHLMWYNSHKIKTSNQWKLWVKVFPSKQMQLLLVIVCHYSILCILYFPQYSIFLVEVIFLIKVPIHSTGETVYWILSFCSNSSWCRKKAEKSNM